MNYNPSIAFNTPNLNLSQAQQTALMLVCVAKYHCTLRDGLLEPEVINLGKKQIPLDMGQYRNLLYSTRIPKREKDYLHQPEVEQGHAVILHRGRFYKIQVMTGNDQIRPVEELLHDVETVLADGESQGQNKHPVCALSLTERNKWASNRNQLIDLGNKNSLVDIDESMVLVVLDDFKYKTPYEALRHGVGGPADNRWPDKSFQLIIGQDSSIQLNFEHAWGDGAAILNIERTIYNYLTKLENPLLTEETKSRECSTYKVQTLDFEINNQIKEEIASAIKEYDFRFSDFQVKTYEVGQAPALLNHHWYQGEDKTVEKSIQVNRKWMKQFKIGADAFMQLSLQFAAAQHYGYGVIDDL